MQPLNPFIRAFVKSSLPSQCTPIQNYILLVPTTEVLLNSFNFESGTSYAELAASEEFLGSHILRVPNQHAGVLEESPNMRENRGKARQYSTFNGKVVVIKDSSVYSNKGFKTHNQAQLLSDTLLYPDSLEPRQWLIYYISQPLVGTLKEIKMPIAYLPKFSPEGKHIPEARIPSEGEELVTSSSLPKKKLIKTFNELLNYFPMIARQLQPGLEHIFKEFNMVFERPLPPPPSADIIPDPEPAELKATNFLAARFNSKNSLPSLRLDSISGKSVVEVMDFEDEEEIMRGALETAITAAIDLFQMVDKQQLSLLGATTDLTGPVVERMIEQYISEQVHSNILYPRICALRRADDLAIESLIKEMAFVDISQVGISIQGGQRGKHELIIRLGRAVDEFRNLNIAGSPQQMMSILLCTLKTVSQLTEPLHIPGNQELTILENSRPVLTINADALVSLLLVVIIRAKVRHLHARLAYMRNFIFVEDVESGEMGYALSTFEAVLSYITYNSTGLRKASAKNKRLWQATKQGDIPGIKKILEPELEKYSKEGEICDDKFTSDSLDRCNPLDSFGSGLRENSYQDSSSISTLCHVYPWQYCLDLKMEEPEQRKKKKVTMDIQSLSSSSEISFHSRAPTIDSIGYGIEGDISIERLSQTQDLFGESLLMMAVQNQQGDSLKYLLSLKKYFPPEFVLGDVNNEGTTLLSAAVQLGYSRSINTILEFLFMQKRTVIKDYLRLQDVRGRSVAHYLFNAPSLITSIGYLLSWKQKDKNGQTPLFAICRSYDHRCYRMMVETALASAKFSSVNGELLHLDDHVDSKGNTLLHIINDPQIAYKILTQCHTNVNATNNRKFTPLMVASKYGRIEMIRVLFGDERTDVFARELRGLAAVELAKDDEVRNRIDDLTLFQGQPAADGRITSVVRSFFVQDATIRLVIKSAAPTSRESYTITTCRRSLADFYHLANLLALENPASWLPSISGMRNPFQLIGRPSRSVLRDIQIRLDNFLQIMLSHSTFATHEMLWEFFLVPDIQPEMMEARSKLKMETRIEKVREEFKPVENVRDVEQFVSFSRDMVRSVNHTTKNVARRANQMWIATTDLHESYQLASRIFSTLEGLPSTHIKALEAYVTSLEPSSTHPYSNFHSAILSLHSTIIAMLMALSRPNSLISTISAINKSIERSLNSLSRSTRWPLGLLDETRQRLNDEKEERIRKEKAEVGEVGRELRYTWGVVAGELAGWQEAHEKMGRKAVKQLVRGMVVRERYVLEGMERAYRKLKIPIIPIKPPDLQIPAFMCETDESTEYLGEIEEDGDEEEEEKTLMNLAEDSIHSEDISHDMSSFENF